MKSRMTELVCYAPYHAISKVAAGISLILCCSQFVLCQATQSAQTTDHKADQNIKSQARINPSTLAMEMSIPLGSYPGRNGISLPITFSYSSKVWDADIVSTKWNKTPDQTCHPNSWVITEYEKARVKYASKSNAGWTSSLASPRIVELGGFLNMAESSSNLLTEINVFYPEIAFELYPGQFTPGGEEEYQCATSYDWARMAWLTRCCWQNQGESYTCSNAWHGGSSGGGGNSCNGGGQDPPPPPHVPPARSFQERVRIRMPDGSETELRKNDNTYVCSFPLPEYCTSHSGTYLAVDGSRLRLERNEVQPDQSTRNVLYLHDGSRYIFNNIANSQLNSFGEAVEHVDSSGNRITFDPIQREWTDTMARELDDPFTLPNLKESNPTSEQIQTISLPSLGETNRSAQLVWKRLKRPECETSTDTGCGTSALEDPAQPLPYIGSEDCDVAINGTVWASNVNQPALFQGHDWTTSSGVFTWNHKKHICGNKTNQPTTRFNPVVLFELILPDGRKYEFKYNVYGEITKITYPNGSIEQFRYEAIEPMGYRMALEFSKSNRGVVERWVYSDEQTLVQHWTYEADLEIVPAVSSTYTVRTFAPNGALSERLLRHKASVGDYSNYLDGTAFDEKTFSAPDSNGNRRLLSRKLTEWTQDGPLPGGVSTATRNPRPVREISIVFENAKALATMSETTYDSNSDISYFASLNPKTVKSYHYLPLTLTDAEAPYDTALSAIKNQFYQSGEVASITETDYLYDPDYKARGITSLPTVVKALNPSNPSEVLSKTQTVYDETNYLVADSATFTGNAASTWLDPSTDQRIPTNSRPLRGLPTTIKTWQKETDSWLEAHTQYDQYGNIRKAWDVSGDSSKFAETQYGLLYYCAYPTKVITPAPAVVANDTHSTDQTSSSETTYDFMTGLRTKVKDDFGQEIQTTYDNMLRPIDLSSVAPFVAPETQTEYGDFPGNLYVKVRKQLDSLNWDESITWFDGLGRTIKTQAKDSQGDVFVESHYDTMGRVDRATNPYRSGDTVYRSKTRFDDTGRAVETYAPTELANLGNAQSLGITTFDISTVTNFVGTVVVTNDASGRKSRSITNALGQLTRVDEATAVGGTANADLGTLASPNQATVYKYDPYGKMVQVTQGVQNRYFKYDSLGRLLRVSQPEQVYNAALDLSDNYNTTGHWTAGFVYDVLGNVIRTTDANGVNIINEYDRASRVTKRCYTIPNVATSATTCAQVSANDLSVDTPTVEFWYDGKGLAAQQSPNYAKGKVTKVDNSVSATEYMSFDNFGRLTRSRQITDGVVYGDDVHPMTYSYNLSGALIEEKYPSGRVVKNEFESDGDLSRIYGKANSNATERTYANTFSYMPDGRIEKLRLGSGLWEAAKFNTRLQVKELALGHGVSAGDVWKLGYEYGEIDGSNNVDTAKNTGNIARQTLSFSGLTQPFVQSYKYDSLFRLTEARETAGSGASAPQTWKETFGYDRFGNRTSHARWNGNTPVTPTVVTDPAVDENTTTNRFTAGQGYAYDSNGNLISDAENRAFTFNADNKQIKVEHSGNKIAEYFYDGEGKRVKKRVYDGSNPPVLTEETIFVYASGKLIAEYSTANPPQNPTTSYTMTDQLGSPRVITNSVGEVVSRRDFRPFGEQVGTDETYRTANLTYNAGDNIRQKFTGYQKDEETKLDFAEARMYENRHGRFTAVDPLIASGKSGSPQTFNRYVYAINSPLAITDPSGLQIAFVPIGGRPRVQDGRWYQPASPDGVMRPRFEAFQPVGYEPITSRNRRGDLVMAYEGAQFDVIGRPDFVLRFNEMGPMSAIPLTDVRTGRTRNEELSDFERRGWEKVQGDGYQSVHPATGAVQDVSLELFLAVEGGVGLTRAGFRSVASRFASEEATSASGLRYWSRNSFDGTRVYQRNDIFDPDLVSSWTEGGSTVTGTNVQRMASGRAPIGMDGRSVELHHMIQTNSSPIAEVSYTFHRTNSRILHINPNSFGSGINRPGFDVWKARYWSHRASGF